MTNARRAVLSNITLQPQSSAHAGLWLDRYLKSQISIGGTDSSQPKTDLVRSVASISVPPIYREGFSRWGEMLAAWDRALQGHGMALEQRRYRCTGRMLTGVGAASVIEAGIRMHHTYGVPYVPGSALKGLAAHYARNYMEPSDWGKNSQAYSTLFGSTDASGCVTFFDALPDPPSPGSLLAEDVMSIHHPKYYRGEEAAPADWDSPTIISFLSATGVYLMAVGGPPGWVTAAYQILDLALAELGIGAKTSAGYGRMVPAEVRTKTTQERPA